MTLLRPATPQPAEQTTTNRPTTGTVVRPAAPQQTLHLRPCSPTTNPSPNGLSLHTLRHAFPG
jgi:hypothetical protein